jgi:hypothetical protein
MKLFWRRKRKAIMTTKDSRLEGLVEKAGIIHTDGMKLRALLGEALEAGAWVTCEKCKGKGYDTEEGLDWECDACAGKGSIPRELVGALWAAARVAEYFCAAGRDAERSIRNRAYKKWGEKKDDLEDLAQAAKKASDSFTKENDYACPSCGCTDISKAKWCCQASEGYR